MKRLLLSILVGALSGYALAAAPMRTQPSPSDLRAASLLGGGLEFSGMRAPGQDFSTMAVPLLLPLGAQIGGLRMGTGLELARKEYRTDGLDRAVEGASYFSLDGSYLAFRSRSYLLEFGESINVPLARGRDQDLPHEARLSLGYVLDSRVSMNWFLRRAQIRFGLEHNWRLADREFNPGESIQGRLTLGYGFGSESGASLRTRWPVNVSLGISSQYTYADRLNNEAIAGTEYGTVFVTPGVHLALDSVNIYANVEIPFRHLRTDEDGYQERMRGNIGMRYYFQ